MWLKKLSLPLLLATLIGVFIPALLFAQQEDQLKRLKKRVAVFEFEDKTDHVYHWWTGQSAGQGMSDMLVTALVKTGSYRVFERQTLEKVMKEQQLGLSGAVTPESAAQVGKLLGVELAIVGSLTEFGYKKGEIGAAAKKIGFGLGVQSTSATVAADVRFISTTTGEILFAESVRKEESKKGLSVDTREISFANQNKFDESIVGKATRAVIDDIVKLMGQKVENIPWSAKVIKGNGTVFINVGAEAGVQVGDVFVVYRKGEELIDPDTGISLGAVESKIGTIVVANNNIGNGKASQCTVKEGSGFQKNDVVRIK